MLLKSTKAPGGVNKRETIAWYDETAIYIPKERIREAAAPDAGELVSCGSSPAIDRSGMTLEKGAENRANSPVASQISFILRLVNSQC